MITCILQERSTSALQRGNSTIKYLGCPAALGLAADLIGQPEMALLTSPVSDGDFSAIEYELLGRMLLLATLCQTEQLCDKLALWHHSQAFSDK
jgi:hypothetical protein